MEVLLWTLKPYINTKLQNQHARTNLLYQGGQYQWIRYKSHANTEGKLMARLIEFHRQQRGGAAIRKEWAIRLRGRPETREEEEEGDHSREGSLYSKEATTGGGGCRGPATTPPDEKENTVGSIHDQRCYASHLDG
jgi:hypothetical protein